MALSQNVNSRYLRFCSMFLRLNLPHFLIFDLLVNQVRYFPKRSNACKAYYVGRTEDRVVERGGEEMAAEDRFGKLTHPDAERDAVHMAVIAVEAGETLDPGARVARSHDRVVTRHRRPQDKVLGVVDPFLEDAVQPGEWFWLFVVPGTVLKLRHSWETRDFPDEPKPEYDDDDGCRGC